MNACKKKLGKTWKKPETRPLNNLKTPKPEKNQINPDWKPYVRGRNNDREKFKNVKFGLLVKNTCFFKKKYKP